MLIHPGTRAHKKRIISRESERVIQDRYIARLNSSRDFANDCDVTPRDTRELYTRVRYAITNHWRACGSYPNEIIESRNTCQAFHRASYGIQTNCTRDVRCRDFSLFFNPFQSVNILFAIYFFFPSQNGNWNICENIWSKIGRTIFSCAFGHVSLWTIFSFRRT